MSEAVIVKRPVVARPKKQASVASIAGAFGLLGVGVFFWLSEARASHNQEDELPALVATTAPAPAPLAPASPGEAAKPAADATFWSPNGPPVKLVATPPAGPSGFLTPTRPLAAAPTGERTTPFAERMRAPALVVDLAQTDPSRTSGSAQSTTTVSDGGTRTTVQVQSPAPSAGRNLSDTEQFSTRVGTEEVQIAQAQQMSGLDRLITQGAVIGGVMETALNSDLPGYARAIVQRDVYSFDGSAVLIPAGSRLIGQYKSGVAQGASRVFVLWTRLIRPDGVSIELASPATDELGRGGIGGKVNRHFLQRFGGAILTSVISGGISVASAALSGGSTIIVGSAGQATNLASLATQNNDIPPTITTKPGATIRIFVARDLDFSGVGPAK